MAAVVAERRPNLVSRGVRQRALTPHEVQQRAMGAFATRWANRYAVGRHIASSDAVETLREITSTHGPEHVIAAAEHIITNPYRLESKSSREFIDADAAHSMVLHTVARLRDRRFLNFLTGPRGLQHPNDRVKLSAISALQVMGHYASPALRTMRAVLNEGNRPGRALPESVRVNLASAIRDISESHLAQVAVERKRRA